MSVAGIGRKKVVKVAPGAGRRTHRNDMTILVFQPDFVRGSADKPSVRSATSSCSVHVLEDFGKPDVLHGQFLAWANDDRHLVYTFPFVPPDVVAEPELSRVVTFLVHSGAGGKKSSLNEWPIVAEDMFPVVRALDDLDLVEVDRADDTTLRCQFTQRAMEDGVLCSFWSLSNPSPALAVRDIPAADKTSYELLRALLDDGPGLSQLLLCVMF